MPTQPHDGNLIQMPEIVVGQYAEVLAELVEGLPYVLVSPIEHVGLYYGLDRIFKVLFHIIYYIIKRKILSLKIVFFVKFSYFKLIYLKFVNTLQI